MTPIPYEEGLHQLTRGVYTFLQPPGSWGLSNAGLIASDDDALLVDTFFDLAHTRALLDDVASVVALGQIGTVVNTHAHGDHTWGNELLPEATIVASRRCKDEMIEADPAVYAAVARDPAAFGKLGTLFRQAFGRFDFEGVTVTLPTRTFEGELSLGVGDREIRLIEVGPAHSTGDVLVHLPGERLLFAGDILFVGGHPVTFTGSIFGWVRALERVLDLDVDTIVPGHGPVSSPAEAAALKAYFEDLIAQARPLFDEGADVLDAARTITPKDGLALPERVAALIAVLYREFAGDESRPSPVETFAAMAELAC